MTGDTVHHVHPLSCSAGPLPHLRRGVITLFPCLGNLLINLYSGEEKNKKKDTSYYSSHRYPSCLRVLRYSIIVFLLTGSCISGRAGIVLKNPFLSSVAVLSPLFKRPPGS